MRESRTDRAKLMNQRVCSGEEEVRTVRKRTKSGKAVGPDGIPVEVCSSAKSTSL